MARARSAVKALEIFKRENESLRAEIAVLKKKLAQLESEKVGYKNVAKTEDMVKEVSGKK